MFRQLVPKFYSLRAKHIVSFLACVCVVVVSGLMADDPARLAMKIILIVFVLRP